MTRKKQTLSISLLCLILLLTACPAAKAESSEESAASSEYSFDLKTSGVSFDLPESMRDLEGVVQPSYGVEIYPGSGVFLSGLAYCAMSHEKYGELAGRSPDLTEEDIEFVEPRIIDFILVYTIDGGRTEEDLLELLPVYGLPSEGCTEIGSAGEYSFYSVVDPHAADGYNGFVFDGAFREEYDTILRECGDVSWIRIYEPVDPAMSANGSMITFETTDLDGNAVSSGDIFKAHRLTMVNIWGTYCGPCINEMPGLEVLNGRLEEKDCAVIGVVCDAADIEDNAKVGKAKEIIADTGVTYLNLLPWDGFLQALPAQYVPTTYFIDQNGQVVGKAAIGAMGADEYEALIDGLLEEME